MMKRWLLLCLGLAFCCTAALPARADDASALRAKHRAFMGFTFGDGTMNSLTTTETLTLDSDHSVLRTTTALRVGAIYRLDVADAKSKEARSSGFTGRIFWSAGTNGFTVPIYGDAAKLALSQDLFSIGALDALPWTLSGTSLIDGTQTQIARVTPKDAFPVDLYVAPDGSLKRAVFDPGGDDEQTINILKYSEPMPGKKIVSSWKFAGSLATHAYTKIAANTPISDTALHPPAQTATWNFADPKPFSIDITPRRIIIGASFNGVPGKFLLDTGAAGIFLNGDYAKRAHITALGSSEASGIAGSMKIKSGTASSFTIGGNTLSNVRVMYGMSSIDPNAPDGLIGFGLLGGAYVTLDVANATLQIEDPASANLSAVAGVHATVDLSSGVPVVPMKINGTATLNALLDSGAPGQVLIPTDFVSKHNLRMLVDNSLIGFFASHQAMGGVSGGYEIDSCGHLDSVALGPIVYQNPAACQSHSFEGNNGLVGFDFLKGFSTLVFDYPRAAMVFVPKH